MNRKISFTAAALASVFATSIIWGQATQPYDGSMQSRVIASSHQDQSAEAKSGHEDNDKPLATDQVDHPVLWEDPGDIARRDLFYGHGGEKGQPKPPFVFLTEDRSGTNPKFDTRDGGDKKWRVKLGEESRPEVVASRLLWAIGYFVNDDYLVPDAEVRDLKMKRKPGDMKGDLVANARFSRKPAGQEKMGIWEWKNNPFTGTRELNGLRVAMAVINNWDLKDVNNAVYQDEKTGRQLFIVSDIGAAFGTNKLSWTRGQSKGNVESFKDSKFITRSTDTEVDFATPSAPTALLAETAGFGIVPYAKRSGLNWIGKNIPLEDVRWIGSLLGQLTHEQLVDAFRAGNFPPDEIAIYVTYLENRIIELKNL